MDGINVLVYSHLVGEHLGAVGARHIGFGFEAGATFGPLQVCFQLFKNLPTAMAGLLIEISVHLSIVDINVSFSATGKWTSGASSEFSSVTVLHVHSQHLHLCRAQRTLLLWLLVIQPLVNSQLDFCEHFCTDVALCRSMRLDMFCPSVRIVELLRTVITSYSFPMVHHLVFHQTALPFELGTGA